MAQQARSPNAAAGDAESGSASLSRREQLLYASASLGSEALLQSRAAWLFFAYAPPPGSGLRQVLPIGLVGVILAATRLLDAVNPPLVGWWSDRTRSRLGRRAPWILAGAPLWALFAVVSILPPPTTQTAATAVAIALALELYNLFGAVAGTPFDALLPEIARTQDERLGLVSARTYFGVAGAAVGLVGSGPLVDRIGVAGMMGIVAGLALVTRYLGLWGVRHRIDRAAPPVTLSLRESVHATLRNPHFLSFLPAFVLFSTGFQLLTGALPYYATAVLHPANLGRTVALMTGAAVLATLAAVPLFTRFARRRSSGEAYRTALILSAVAFPLLAVAGLVPGIPPLAQVLVAMVAVGAPTAGVYLFPAALAADIVDADASDGGVRREGMFFGVQGLLERVTSAFSPLVLGGLLLLGASPDDALGVRLVGPVAALFVFAGYLGFRSYGLGASGADGKAGG